MADAQVVQQLLVKTGTRVGLLADVTGALSGVGVNITGICAYEEEGDAYFMLMTSDDGAAKAALEGLGAEVTSESVVAVDMPNRPGALEEAAGKLAAADINVDYMYGSVASADSAVVIFRTGDAARTAAVIGA
jgi:hypothetical protein